MTSITNFWEGWKADQDDTLHYVWVDTDDGGETCQLPFKAIRRLDFYPLIAGGFVVGYVPTDWWLEIGKAFLVANPNAVVRAAGGGNAEDAVERFVQDADYWFEGLPN